MKIVIWLLLIALVLLHQDSWYWTDGRLVFGLLPIGLFYHMVLSVAASITWLLAAKFAWPVESESPDLEADGAGEAGA